jgi:hypothetical protein
MGGDGPLAATAQSSAELAIRDQARAEHGGFRHRALDALRRD